MKKSAGRGKLVSHLGILSVACLAAASGMCEEVVWRDSFDDAAAKTRWNCDRGYSVRPSEGVDGGGALVWEEKSFRPMERRVAETTEGNAVRPAATVGSTQCWRRFPVDAGHRYIFSVKVKGAITNNCGYIFFRWFDKDGKMLGRSEGRPTIYRQVGRNGWETVKAGSQRLPSDAVTGEVYIEVYRTTLGKMCFDDFTMMRDPRRSVERIHSSAYRDETDKGVVRFVLPYAASRTRYPETKISGLFTFAGESGPFTVPSDTVAEDRVEVSLDVSKLKVGTHPVKAVLKAGDEILGECEGEFTRSAVPVRRKVHFDGRGRTIVNGKPFFPLGVYVHPRDSEVPYLNRLKDSPFNCIIECSANRKMLDKFHAAGLMAIPRSHWKENDIRSVYAALKNHPALLAWYIIDETPVDYAAEQIKLYKIRKEVDPDHPTFAVLDYPRNVDAFMGAFDVVASDPYPIGYKRPHIGIAAEYPVICRKRSYGIRPLWQVPQSFAWDWCHKHGHPKEDRYPTYDELRSMAWQAIAGGANGLLWYSAHHIFKCSPKEDLEKNWGDLVKVAAEIKSHVEILLSEEIPPEATSSSGDIAVRSFRKDGKLWILAVNKTGSPASGRIAVDGAGERELSLAPFEAVMRRY